MDLIRAVRYGQAFRFKYSPRPGTPAAERPQVDPAEAADRLHRLQALITAQAAEVMAAMVGREVGVLFEKPGRMPGQMAGKSDHLHAVHVDGRDVAVQGELAPGQNHRGRSELPVGRTCLIRTITGAEIRAFRVIHRLSTTFSPWTRFVRPIAANCTI